VIVSGFHPVREVLERRPRSVEVLLVQRGRKDARAAEIEELARGKGVSVRIVAKEELDRAAGRAHNGVAARVAEREYDDAEECLAGEKGSRCVLFLDEVTDPGNLGSVLRSAAAAGAAVVLTERHSAGLNETVSKASAGALERVKVGRVVNAARFIAQAKAAGFWVFGAAMEGENLFSVDISGDVVLCLGSEGTGLRRLTKESCDRLISIPMRPGAGSLNVAVAAGILVFEWVRRRTSSESSPGMKMA
jgi:23S rRNA (guanosine2251-2'-O)-methyltransferase